MSSICGRLFLLGDYRVTYKRSGLLVRIPRRATLRARRRAGDGRIPSHRRHPNTLITATVPQNVKCHSLLIHCVRHNSSLLSRQSIHMSSRESKTLKEKNDADELPAIMLMYDRSDLTENSDSIAARRRSSIIKPVGVINRSRSAQKSSSPHKIKKEKEQHTTQVRGRSRFPLCLRHLPWRLY